MEQENNTSNAGATPAAPAAPADQKQKNMLVGILSYIGILVVVAYLLGKDDPSAKFHIKQGAVLFVLELAVMVVSYMMLFFAPIAMIINLGLIVLSIIGIVNVIQGKEKELPLVGGLSKHIPI